MKFKNKLAIKGKVLVFFGLAFVFSAKAFANKNSKNHQEISFMTFNVENLFDTQHDENRDDETYLPLKLKQNAKHKAKCKKIKNKFYKKECFQLDWNDQVLNAKMKNISETILSVDGGVGPDILILNEVENIHVLKEFNSKYLSAAKYRTIELIEGFDTRGIDIAILSRFEKKKESVLHKIPNEKMNKMRGLLEVRLKTTDKNDIIVFGGHFPSQSNPTFMREQAINFLGQLIDANKKNLVLAGGDFNITDKEESKHGYIRKYLVSRGKVSHFFGCSDCEGTHYYRGHWSFLDILFVNNTFQEKGYFVDPDSIKVVKNNPKHNNDGKPERFDPENLTGASDHFPIYLKIRKKE